MRSRRWLLGVVALGVGVAAVLLLWPRSTDHHSDEVADVPPTPPPGGADRPRPSLEPTASGKPARGEADEPESAPGETTRDHRGQGVVAARRGPGEGPVRVVQPPVIRDLREAVRPELKKCSDQFASDVQPNAQIRGSLRVAVRSGVVTVLDVKVDHSGIAESSGLIECARKAFASAELRADGHAEVESHTLRLPFRIPVK
jgi:hypothetical protein